MIIHHVMVVYGTWRYALSTCKGTRHNWSFEVCVFVWQALHVMRMWNVVISEHLMEILGCHTYTIMWYHRHNMYDTIWCLFCSQCTICADMNDQHGYMCIWNYVSYIYNSHMYNFLVMHLWDMYHWQHTCTFVLLLYTIQFYNGLRYVKGITTIMTLDLSHYMARTHYMSNQVLVMYCHTYMYNLVTICVLVERDTWILSYIIALL